MLNPVRKQCDPEDYDSEDTFLEACMADGTDEDTCQQIWEDKAAKTPVVRKTHISTDVQGMEFVLSDESVDRYGDVINANGWDLSSFRKNPIALFGHRSDFPIGTWENVRVVGKELRGHLALAKKETSARVAEIVSLIEQGILKATSVGFAPIETRPLEKSAGTFYAKQALMECSVVSIPANENALAVAKALKISADTVDLVFGKHAEKNKVVTRSTNGKHAETRKVNKGGRTMSGPITISQRAKAAEDKVVELKDKLTAHMETYDDDAPTSEQKETTDALTAEIEQSESTRDQLKRVEKSLAITSRPPPEISAERETSEQGMAVSGRMPFASVTKKLRPSDYIWKALTVQVKAYTNPRMSINEVVQKTYAGQDRLHDNIHAMYNGLVTRGAQTVGTTTTATWAAELITVGIGDFFDLLQPVSIYARLSALGGRFTFGPNGVVSIPYRTNTATVGGAFVAQGGNIPVKKASFSAINLTPKKCAVISTFTRELAEHSTPSIEALIRDAIVNDTATAIDAILMDTNVATTTRPAGLGAGLSTQTPTSPGTDLTGVIGDLKVMANALASASNGNIRTPVWIMGPGQANAIGFSNISTIGMMPFRDEIQQGRFNGWPVIISSSTIPADTIWLLDANDFVTATGDTPNFVVSDQAVIVMDDAPTDIVTGGTAFAGAVKSMYQTDSIAVRMIMDINWAMRRTGMVLFMTGINWSP